MKKEEFIQRLESFGLPKNEYLIRSGGSMLLRGLREETADFDLCVSEALAQRLDLEKYPKDEVGSYVPFKDVQMKANLSKMWKLHSSAHGENCYQILLQGKSGRRKSSRVIHSKGCGESSSLP